MVGDSYLRGALVLMEQYKQHGNIECFSILERGKKRVRVGTEQDALEIVRLYKKVGYDFENGKWKKKLNESN
jgi:hypothetical protein